MLCVHYFYNGNTLKNYRDLIQWKYIEKLHGDLIRWKITRKIRQRRETFHRYYTSLRKICQEKDTSVARTKERKRLIELVLTYDEHVTDTDNFFAPVWFMNIIRVYADLTFVQRRKRLVTAIKSEWKKKCETVRRKIVVYSRVDRR